MHRVHTIAAPPKGVALRLVPDPGTTASVPLPRWDLPARMVLATVLVIAITMMVSVIVLAKKMGLRYVDPRDFGRLQRGERVSDPGAVGGVLRYLLAQGVSGLSVGQTHTFRDVTITAAAAPRA